MSIAHRIKQKEGQAKVFARGEGSTAWGFAREKEELG